MAPHLNEFEFARLVDVELADENTYALPLLIRKNIEAFILIVIEQTYDMGNIVQVIKVDVYPLVEIDPEPIMLACDQKDVLLHIGNEEIRLRHKSVRELINDLQALLLVVQSKDLIHTHENQSAVLLFSIHLFLEHEAHANFVEDWNILHYYSLV